MYSKRCPLLPAEVREAAEGAAPVLVPAVPAPVPVLVEVARRYLLSDKVMYAAAVTNANG